MKKKFSHTAFLAISFGIAAFIIRFSNNNTTVTAITVAALLLIIGFSFSDFWPKSTIAVLALIGVVGAGYLGIQWLAELNSPKTQIISGLFLQHNKELAGYEAATVLLLISAIVGLVASVAIFIEKLPPIIPAILLCIVGVLPLFGDTSALFGLPMSFAGVLGIIRGSKIKTLRGQKVKESKVSEVKESKASEVKESKASEVKESKALKTARWEGIMKGKVRWIVLSVLVFAGIVISSAIGTALGGGDLPAYKLGEFLGSALGASLFIYIASILLTKKWPGIFTILKQWSLVVGASLAIIITGVRGINDINFYRSIKAAEKVMNTATDIVDMKNKLAHIGGPAASMVFKAAQVTQSELDLKGIVNRYPIFIADEVYEPLPTNNSLTTMQKYRAAQSEASEAATKIAMESHQLINRVLNDIPPVLQGAPSWAVSSIVRILKKNMDIQGASWFAYLAAAKVRFDTMGQFSDFMVTNYGTWQYTNGQYIFKTQAQADQFNSLLTAANDAIAKWQDALKKAQS